MDKILQRLRSLGFWLVLLVALLVFALPAGAVESPKASNSTKSTSVKDYPTTPEGVVQAYVQADFDGKGYTGSTLHEKWQYTTWTEGGGDSVVLISDFKVRKMREDIQTADVLVEYKVLATVHGGVYLEISTIAESWNYRLIKTNGMWKIVTPQLPSHRGTTPEQFVSLKQTLKVYDYGLADNDSSDSSDGTNYPPTPEGVVEAFVREDYEGARALQKDTGKLQRYVLFGVSNERPHWGIISSYRVKKLKQDADTAEVQVDYEYMAGLSQVSLGYYLAWESDFKSESCVFNLRKQGGRWKVQGPSRGPLISPKVALDILRKAESAEKDPKNLKSIRGGIRFLEKKS